MLASKNLLIALNNKIYKSYINEPFSWNHVPYDILSICYFNIGEYQKSLNNVIEAINFSPFEERLLENKKIIENAIIKNQEKTS